MIVLTPLLLALAAPQADQIHTAAGDTVVGEVTAATLKAVDYRNARGEERSLAPAEVLSIDYRPQPELYVKARDFLEKQDFQNAVNGFDAAAREGGRWWLEPMCRLGRAETLLAWSAVDPGRAAEALEAYREWLSRWPDSFHSIEARIGEARALARTGQHDEAARRMEQLASDAFRGNLGAHVEHRAQLVRCRILLEGGQAQVAETRLGDLIGKLEEDLRKQDLGQGARQLLRRLHASCQIALGDARVAREGAARAASYWEGLLRRQGLAPDVRAAALIGLAQAAREEGQLREAQLRLAEVVATLHVQDPEVMARALFALGEVTAELDDTPTPSRDYFQQVVEDYPNTAWALEARRRLGS